MAAKGRSNQGERHPFAKLTATDVLAIRADDRMGRDIATGYGISKSIVSQIKSRQIWRHIP